MNANYNCRWEDNPVRVRIPQFGPKGPTTLRRDQDAIAAALQLPWSNGMVEGQIHRLKLIKRQMYGRASFDLLRLRVLHSA